MRLMSTYAVKISRSADIRSTLSATAGIYRKAVDFFIDVCEKEWGTVSSGKGQNEKAKTVELFTIKPLAYHMLENRWHGRCTRPGKSMTQGTTKDKKK